MEKTRLLPGIEKAISDINENDSRVRILGTIRARHEDGTCEIDDGTGTAVAFFESSKHFPEMENGKLVRIIGKVRKNENSGEKTGIDAEIASDMSMVDLGLLERTNDVIEKLKGLR
jgi:RPA family protein